LRENGCCYLLERGRSDADVAGTLEVTPEAVRHCGKCARAYMVAVVAVKRMISHNIFSAVR